MIEIFQQLNQIDTDIFLFFNGMHNSFCDYFMYMFSHRFAWIPFYASILFVLTKNYPPKMVVSILVAIVMLVVLCDQTSSGLLKPMVARLRPSNMDNPISPMVHIVQGYRGGAYGFPSSHASNTWGLAFFAMYLVRNIKFSSFLVVWALLTCYSRMYLGVHYFGDILVGSFIGLLSATIVYWVYRYFCHTYTDRLKKDGANVLSIKYSYLPITIGIATIFSIVVASAVFNMYGINMR